MSWLLVLSLLGLSSVLYKFSFNCLNEIFCAGWLLRTWRLFCLLIKRLVQLFMRIKDRRMAILVKGMQGFFVKMRTSLFDAEPQTLTRKLSISGMCLSLLLWLIVQIWAKWWACESLSLKMFCKNLWGLMSLSPWMFYYFLLPWARGSLFTFTAHIDSVSMPHPHAQKSIKHLTSFSVLALSSQSLLLA